MAELRFDLKDFETVNRKHYEERREAQIRKHAFDDGDQVGCGCVIYNRNGHALQFVNPNCKFDMKYIGKTRIGRDCMEGRRRWR